MITGDYRSKDKEVCDTNNWSDYTDADCTDEETETFLPFFVLAAAGSCKDAAGVTMMLDAMETSTGDICGSKGTTKAAITTAKG